MRNLWIFLFPLLFLCVQCDSPEKETGHISSPDFSNISRIDSGVANAVMLTAYSTTLLADGYDRTVLRIAVVDSLSREITSATDSIRVYIAGNAHLEDEQGNRLEMFSDTAGKSFAVCKLEKGLCHLNFIAGREPDRIKVEARSGSLWPGGHEIHTILPDFTRMKPSPAQLTPVNRDIRRMIGADVSFLPQIEQEWNRKFYENGEEIDALDLLKKHGFNYIRLRIFVNPENEKGYAPGKGYCGLDYTLEMAHRIKKAGMRFLLDFHYSDYWADPQQQYKPERWETLDYETLQDSLREYTSHVLQVLKKQGTLPDMVQLGNEINHGILWPDGHIGNPDALAELLQAAVNGVRAVDNDLPVMMHIALGGQNSEAVFWLDNMIARGVTFDIVGISYYPRWHGTLEDLYFNLHDLQKRYHKPINVVEYNDFKKEVHDIVFGLPDDMGKGACIWEPLGWRSGMFDREGHVNDQISIYDKLHAKYLKGD
jgi:hypothetical protein